ncbi:MAG: serine hydrolase [Sphingomonas sp.]|uniref:serine hydrolase n=1 Tax=Sphingomonas sp. TaxID=28214 RepID=UPI001B047568|nr:serine hydrolase [Sphingomonas sp.]MBO9623641.1 serine hydrolase [Sphingomonas sp.]
MGGLQLNRREALAWSLAGIGAAALPGLALAQDAAPADAAIDDIVARFMAAFETPGIAVAVIRPGRPAYLKGYGVRTLGKPAPVGIHTRFGIASNSKSFTAAALAMLVEEGKVAWDKPVKDYLPEFRMHDPRVTEMLTVRDLLVHNSGLALGAGDLMQFPASDRPPSDALKALPFLAAERGFRSGYAYDNILYVVAGILIERLSGKPWHAFVSERLLRPIGMADAVPAARFLNTDDVAGRHARLGPPVRGMGPIEVIEPREGIMTDAAGGINASVSDVAKWLQLQLAGGKLPDGRALWSPAQQAEMWKPQTIVAWGDGPSDSWPARGVTQTYALGWFIQDYRGERLVHHSGGLSGQVTQTAMLPAHQAAVVVLSNSEDSISSGIRNALLDQIVGAPAFDWVAAVRARVKAEQDAALAELGSGGVDKAPAGGPSLPLSAYAGRFRDPWYGDIVVSPRGKGLHIDFLPSPGFKSMLEPWGPDTFRTRFPKGVGEDATVTFAVADGKVTGVTMKPLSPLADFSYDFQHLAFAPVR